MAPSVRREGWDRKPVPRGTLERRVLGPLSVRDPDFRAGGVRLSQGPPHRLRGAPDRRAHRRCVGGHTSDPRPHRVRRRVRPPVRPADRDGPRRPVGHGPPRALPRRAQGAAPGVAGGDRRARRVGCPAPPQGRRCRGGSQHRHRRRLPGDQRAGVPRQRRPRTASSAGCSPCSAAAWSRSWPAWPAWSRTTASSRPPFGRAVKVVAERLVGIYSTPLHAGRHGGHFDHFVAPGLTAVGIGLLGYLLVLAVRPVVMSHRPPPGDFPRAREIVRRWGGDTLSYFALRDDKRWWFSDDGQSVVAYAVIGGVCLVSPDPIGPPALRTEVWRAFHHYADGHGWPVAVMAAGAEWLPVYARGGDARPLRRRRGRRGLPDVLARRRPHEGAPPGRQPDRQVRVPDGVLRPRPRRAGSAGPAASGDGREPAGRGGARVLHDARADLRS